MTLCLTHKRLPCDGCQFYPQAESYDDDIGPTDDLIGSVQFPLEDIGLKDDGSPLECWMVLGKEYQFMHHHSRKMLVEAY